MQVGDLVKYNNEWSALNDILGVVLGFCGHRLLVKVLTLDGMTLKFSINNLEVV